MKTMFWMGVGIILFTPCAQSFAGTANVSFSCDTGPLTYRAAGSGTLTATGGQGTFSGANTTLVAQSGSPVSSTGVITASMTLQPSPNAGNGVGIIMTGQGDSFTAMVSPDGTVTLTDCWGTSVSDQFTYPAASNNTVTVTYDTNSAVAYMSLNGRSPVTLTMAACDINSVQVGVTSNGTGSFSNFTATGSGISNYTSVTFGFTDLPFGGWREGLDLLEMRVGVTASSGTVSYQWMKNGAILPGETGNTLLFSSLALTDTGSYVCRVTDSCPMTHDTPPAILTVYPQNSLPVTGSTGLFVLMGVFVLTGVFVLLRSRRQTAAR